MPRPRWNQRMSTGLPTGGGSDVPPIITDEITGTPTGPVGGGFGGTNITGLFNKWGGGTPIGEGGDYVNILGQTLDPSDPGFDPNDPGTFKKDPGDKETVIVDPGEPTDPWGKPKNWFGLDFFPTGGENTTAGGDPRGFGMDWFSDLWRFWDQGEFDEVQRGEMAGDISFNMGMNMINIMNRLANQGKFGKEGIEHIMKGEERESMLRRKTLKKRLEKTMGRKLGPRASGAMDRMVMSEIEAPMFADLESLRRGLRKENLESRLGGVEGLGQLMNWFQALSLGQQTQSTGGPGALDTIGDVTKIASQIASMIALL